MKAVALESYFMNYISSARVPSCNSDRSHLKYDVNGCFMQGCEHMYALTGKNEFHAFIRHSLKNFVDAILSIRHCDFPKVNLNSIGLGRILLYLYDDTKEEEYKTVCDVLMNQLKHQPRLSTENFGHDFSRSRQLWLNDLYTFMPFYLEYENRFEDYIGYADIVKQLIYTDTLLTDQETGLLYPAYDEQRTSVWANPQNGVFPNFCLCSIGWYLMTLVDCYELADEELYDSKRCIGNLFRKAVKCVLRWQDAGSKLFYQLIALPHEQGNYLETLGSLMISYSILKACRLELLLEDKYIGIGQDIFEAILDKKIVVLNGEEHLIDICMEANPATQQSHNGSIKACLSDPVMQDTPTAVGVLMMTYAEYQKSKGAFSHEED